MPPVNWALRLKFKDKADNNNLRILLFILLFCSGICPCAYGQANIIGYEYWFDAAYNNRTVKTFKGSSTYTFDSAVNVGHLTSGLHQFNIRFQNDDTTWSVTQSAYFIKSITNTGSSGIAAFEYWFDDDYGNRRVKALSKRNVQYIDELLLSDSLSPGLHTCNVRFKDDAGLWSAVQVSYFIKSMNLQGSEAITEIEYWFDDDGTKRKNIRLNKQNTHFIDQAISAEHLADGLHTCNLRFRAGNGLWSVVHNSYFLKLRSGGQDNRMVAYRYWFDKGVTTPIEVMIASPAMDLNILPEVKTYRLDTGEFTFYFQVKDSAGRWSPVVSRTFRKLGRPALYRITPNQGGNTGDVTASIYGDGLFPGCRVMLIKGSDTIRVPDTLTAIVRGNRIVAELDLRGVDTGMYDVWVDNPEADTVMVLKGGFRVEEGTGPKPWVSVLQLRAIRVGQWQRISINYGNTGNIDARGVPLMIAVPMDVELGLNDLKLHKLDTSYIKYDTTLSYFEVDTVLGMPFRGKLYSLFVANIPAYSVRTLVLRVRTSSSGSYELKSWVNGPFFGSPLKYLIGECGTWIVEGAIKVISKKAPIVGCVYGLLDLGLSPWVQWAVEGIESFQADEVFGDLGNKIVNTTIDCMGVTPFKALIDAKNLKDAKDLTEYTVLRDVVNRFVDFEHATGFFGQASDAYGGLKCVGEFKRFSDAALKFMSVNSLDPNDKIGPSGFNGSKNFNPILPLFYQVNFENVDTATAAAQIVTVIDTLDKQVFDLSTFQFGLISVGDTLIYPTPGLFKSTAEVNLSAKGINELCRVYMELDTAKGIVTWEFVSLDPFSEEPVSDPFGGFLPPNKTAPEGQGSVCYSLKLKPGLPMSTKVANKAAIYFDNNKPIITPEWVNIIDNIAPVSFVDTLPAYMTDSAFDVQWNGKDSGSGVLSYSLYYAVNGGPFKLWLNHTPNSSGTFYGNWDSCYSFYCVARDTALNEEVKVPLTETSTLVRRMKPMIDTLGFTWLCEGDSVVLRAPDGVGYRWSEGDTTQRITVKESGKYSVRVLTSSGCELTTPAVDVVVSARPKAAFTINDSGQCLKGNSFLFSDASTIDKGRLNYYWDFGNGMNDTSQNPTVQYDSSGRYKVRLAVLSVAGCRDTIEKQVYVHPDVIAAFSTDDDEQCLDGNEFSFVNESKLYSGSVNYMWRFGDSTDSKLENIRAKSFSAPGKYKVKLIAITDKGCRDSVFKLVYVHPEPRAAFVVNEVRQCFNGHSFDFTNKSGIDSGKLTYRWDHGDNTNAVTEDSRGKLYKENYGIFKVNLLATSEKGCVDTAYQDVYLYASPKSDFEVNDSVQCYKGHSFDFLNKSTIAADSMRFKWFHGDTTTSDSVNSLAKKYNAGFGSFQVKLFAQSTKGCKDSMTRTVVVKATPLARFEVNDSVQCFNSHSFDFENITTIGEGACTYLWRHGDSTTASTINSKNKTYFAPFGVYNAELLAISNKGCRDSFSMRVQINASPKADFMINDTDQCYKGHSFDFINTSGIAAGTNSYVWNHGDYSSSISMDSKQKKYSNKFGIYKVQLIATSNEGCVDSVNRMVQVFASPEVDFSIVSASQCFKGHAFDFVNHSGIAYGNMIFKWHYDGELFSSDTDVVKATFADSFGSHSVKLMAISDRSCKDSTSRTIVIHPQTAISFDADMAAQCNAVDTFKFQNNSKLLAGTITNSWDFGDGYFSSLEHPSHSYSAADTFTVRLITKTDQECLDTMYKFVIVHPQVSLAFNVNNPSQCLKANLFGVDDNSILLSGVYTTKWDFGDGRFVDSVANVIHAFGTSGAKVIRLMSTTDQGCTDTLEKRVMVFPQTDAGFSINYSEVCHRYNQFVCMDTSKLAIGTYRVNWDFGDAGRDSGSNVSHVYRKDGQYKITMTTATNDNCLDTVEKLVIVHPQTSCQLTIDKDSQCISGNLFSAVDLSIIQTGSFERKVDFGDGNTYSSSSVSHRYDSDGVYMLRLTTISDKGCQDTLDKQLVVHPKPDVGFNLNDSVQCLIGNSFEFTSSTTIKSGRLTDYWSFGDGNIDTGETVSNVYGNYGLYELKLHSVSEFGCSDSVSQLITVNQNPEKPRIWKKGVLLFTDADSVIQWFYNGEILPDQNRDRIAASSTGTYSVLTTNEYGCTQLSDEFNYLFNGSEELGVLVYPNPSNGNFEVTSLAPLESLEVLDLKGRLVLKKSHLNGSQQEAISLQVNPSIYFLRVYSKLGVEVIRFSVQ